MTLYFPLVLFLIQSLVIVLNEDSDNVFDDVTDNIDPDKNTDIFDVNNKYWLPEEFRTCHEMSSGVDF